MVGMALLGVDIVVVLIVAVVGHGGDMGTGFAPAKRV
jgi:hypothetical protein